MSENSIEPIGSVRAVAAKDTLSKSPMTSQAETMLSQKPGDSNPQHAANQIDLHAAHGENSNVSVHFRLDDKTHELTVFVVDRKTKRVLRSIPASELHKLQAGELLKLTA